MTWRSRAQAPDSWIIVQALSGRSTLADMAVVTTAGAAPALRMTMERVMTGRSRQIVSSSATSTPLGRSMSVISTESASASSST